MRVHAVYLHQVQTGWRPAVSQRLMRGQRSDDVNKTTHIRVQNQGRVQRHSHHEFQQAVNLLLHRQWQQNHVQPQCLHRLLVLLLQDQVEDGHVKVKEASREDGVIHVRVALAQNLKGLPFGVAVTLVKLVLCQYGCTWWESCLVTGFCCQAGCPMRKRLGSHL